MIAEKLLDQLHGLGALLRAQGDTLIIDAPEGALTDDLKAQLRVHKRELLALLSAPPAEPVAGFLLPLDLDTIADAISSGSRSPVEGDLSIARVAQAAVVCARIVRDLPDQARKEAVAMCAAASGEVVGLIEQRDYLGAYELLGDLPRRLNGLRLQ